MSSISRRVWVTRCRWPTGLRRVAGQRHVDAVLGQAAVELGRLELRGALLEQRLERLAHLVGGLADRAALLGRQLADRAQRRGQLGLAARGSGPAAPRARRRGRRRAIAASASRAQLVQVSHGAAILFATSYSATVAAIATFSDSGPSAAAGSARRARGLAARRQALALGAEAAARPGGAPAHRSARSRAAHRARRVVPAELVEAARARAAGAKMRAHARPHRLRRVRVGAARPERPPGRPRARAPSG